MINEEPTNALRLPDRFAQLATDAAWARNVDKATTMMVDLDDLYALLLAAKSAPASPLPGGGKDAYAILELSQQIARSNEDRNSSVKIQKWAAEKLLGMVQAK